MDAIKHDHHVVPQFYLRRFANETKEIRQIDKTTRVSTVIPVKAATIIKDFYLVDGKDGTEHDILENFLDRGVESNGARSLARVIDQHVWPLNDLARIRIAKWVAAQFLRTPRSRQFLDASMNEHRKTLDRLTLENVRDMLGNPTLSDDQIRAKWQETLDYYRADGPQPRNAHARWFLGFLEETSRSLFMRNWQLSCFPEPTLLTSDSPVLALTGDDVFEPTFFVAAAPIVMVPLSRQFLLTLQRPQTTIQSGGDGFAPATDQIAQTVNLLTAANADAQIYEHPEDDIIARLPRVTP